MQQLSATDALFLTQESQCANSWLTLIAPSMRSRSSRSVVGYRQHGGAAFGARHTDGVLVLKMTTDLDYSEDYSDPEADV